MMRRGLFLTFVVVCIASVSTVVHAVDFDRIRIGDRDGFGFGTGAGLLNFQGNPVNVDGIDVLGPGPPLADFLPDLNQDGLVQHFQGDDFDNRSGGEIAGTFVEGSGFTDSGSTGAQFTDVALSQSYDATFPTPNNFPDPPSGDRNNASLEFRFFVATGNVVPGVSIFLNIVFADIGLVAGDIVVTFADNSQITLTANPIDPTVEDGLIGASAVALAFASVFSVAPGGWDGFVDVTFITRPGVAGGDPFYALDYIELSPIEGPVPVQKATWGQIKATYE